MKVTIRWNEIVDYRSEITVHEGEIRSWLEENGHDDTTEIDEQVVLEFLMSGEESEWFEQCNTDMDWDGVQRRELDEVEEILLPTPNAAGS